MLLSNEHHSAVNLFENEMQFQNRIWVSSGILAFLENVFGVDFATINKKVLCDGNGKSDREILFDKQGKVELYETAFPHFS